jgi:hypothetical protein
MNMLHAASSFAGDLLEATSSTARVQAMVQLSLTPAFLLAAIGAFINVMNQRLTWLVERVYILENRQEKEIPDSEIGQLPVLRQRRKFAHVSINLCTAAALLICLVVALTFVSAFVKPPMGTYVAGCWIVAMALVFAGLLSFLMETRLATRSIWATRELSRKLEAKTEEGDANG